MALTEKQQRFFDLIETSSVADWILPFFDIEKRQLKLDMIESQIQTLSHGEQIMLRFFAGLWLNDNRFGFDLFDAVGTLDHQNMEIITDWLSDPFWP
jgi:hypothetical protein